MDKRPQLLKSMRYGLFLTALGILLSTYTATASVSLSFSIGAIRSANGSAVPIGSIGVLVADTLGDGFGTDTSLVGSTLSIGSSLGGGDNLIIAAFTAGDIGSGVIGFSNGVDYSYSGNFNEGDLLKLYWFPTISAVGVTLQTGVNYGSYRTDTRDTASGSEIGFVAPTDGSSPNLFAYDTSLVSNAIASPANLTALSYTAIPEPSSIALVSAGGALVMGAALRRRKTA